MYKFTISKRALLLVLKRAQKQPPIAVRHLLKPARGSHNQSVGSGNVGGDACTRAATCCCVASAEACQEQPQPKQTGWHCQCRCMHRIRSA
eukprot:1160014-Pelagomonas_calceolata.AAC.4